MEFRNRTINEVSENKKKYENKLKVKIEIKGNHINLEGDELDVYFAEKIFFAFDRNFPMEVALLLLDENYVFQEIPIRSITKRKNLTLIKSRIIGTQGKTLKIISELSDCYVTLYENNIFIIGLSEKIKFCENAIKSLVLGNKQANVYAYLERNRNKVYSEDLGLKTKE